MKKGFTLIEVILVAALITLLGSLVSAFYSGFYLKNATNSASTQLTAELHKAQVYSMTSKQGSGWGVAATSGAIVLYEGNSYATRNSAFDETYVVPSTVSISNFTEVDFARVTGYPNAIAAAMITGGGTTYQVNVQSQGIIALSSPFTTGNFNLVPTLTSISPTSTSVGSSSFILTANGTNFITSSVIKWNGSVLTTTYISAVQLTTTVLAANLTLSGGYPITVTNPSPGGGTSGGKTFTVIGAGNAPPNPPSEDSPLYNATNTPLNPVFKMTATDPNSDLLQYGVTIYSNNLCTSVVQTNNETSTQTGWSGQNASSSSAFTSGTQGTYTTQTALTASTTYYWKASAIDPWGSNMATTSVACNQFTTAPTTNPVPTLTSLSPTSTFAGNVTTTLTLTGTNFIASSTVNWTGSGASLNGYSYQRSIVVTTSISIASGTQSNFPMLVSSTNATFEPVSKGGHVQNVCTAPNGGQEPCDLVFTSDAGCSTLLNFETESYSSSTGALVDWVKVPSLSAGTTIYACYGKSSSSTDQSRPTSTWNSNYTAVYHLANTPSISLIDSASGGPGALSANNVATASGEVGGAAYFNGSTAYASTSWSTGSYPASGEESAWTYFTGGACSGGVIVNPSEDGYEDGIMLTGDDDCSGSNQVNKLNWIDSNSIGEAQDAPGLTENAWHYLVFTWNSNAGNTTSTISIYQDGALASSTNYSAGVGPGHGGNYIEIGGATAGEGYYPGDLDEVRYESGAFNSASWIKTEYNNQSNPGTFYALGSETVGGGGGTSALATTYASSTQLTASIPKASLALVGTSSVTVVNPTPGGGTSATSTFTIVANSPPNSPSQDSPATSATGTILNPVFKMTATDPNSDLLQYGVTIYSNNLCTSVVQTNNETSTQTGWSGQNASSSSAFTSGTQGTYTTQTALTASTTYYWKASAIDPWGSNIATTSATCNTFTTEPRRIFFTASGNWTVPTDWVNASNTIEVIAGGGGGGTGGTSNTTNSGAGGGSGGGGAYSIKTNLTLTPGAQVSLVVGSGGAAAATGTDSYFCNATTNCGNIASSSVQAGAKGGGPGTAGSTSAKGAAGAGGASASGFGTYKVNGGTGAAGGATSTTVGGGGAGAGGGSGCGSASCNISSQGAAGSTGNAGSGQTGGVGGKGDNTYGGTGGTAAGGTGGAGAEWGTGYGAGGGGGGGTGGASNTAASVTGGPGGTYGAGGGGGGGGGKASSGTKAGTAGGAGKQGIIVVTY